MNQSTAPNSAARYLEPIAVPPAPLENKAPITGFAAAINTGFKAVDISRVASGILEKYGLQFIVHTPFTGTNGFTTANQVDINRWRAIYADLY